MTQPVAGTGISVVVPAWGPEYAALVVRATSSVQHSLPGAVVVVVDNGSDPPLSPVPGTVHVRLDQTGGLSAARAAGLQRVDTPWVVFLDADDSLCTGIADAAELARRGDHVLVAGALRRRQDPGIPRLGSWPPAYAARLARWPRLFCVANAVRPMLPVIGAAVLSVDAVRRVGLTHLPVDEDWLLSVRLSRAGALSLRLTPDRPALLYRTAPGTLSRRAVDLEEQRQAHWQVLDEALVGLPGARLLAVPLRVVQKRVRARRAKAWGQRPVVGRELTPGTPAARP